MKRNMIHACTEMACLHVFPRGFRGPFPPRLWTSRALRCLTESTKLPSRVSSCELPGRWNFKEHNWSTKGEQTRQAWGPIPTQKRGPTQRQLPRNIATTKGWCHCKCTLVLLMLLTQQITAAQSFARKTKHLNQQRWSPHTKPMCFRCSVRCWMRNPC